MNPYVAEALAALQAKGYSQTDAQAIIDRFLAANPLDEHRLFAALDLGTSAVTGDQLLAAAKADTDLATRAYVRNLIPGDTTIDAYLHPTVGAGVAPPSAAISWWIPLALVGAAAFIYFRSR
jgi:hypothetical protein